MRGFDDIVLSWAGAEYRVPAQRQMELILRVEDGVIGRERGFQAVQILLRPGGLPMARLADVYAAALSYAGAEVTNLEVYHALADAARDGDGSLVQTAFDALLGILGVIGPEAEDIDTTEAAEAARDGAAKKAAAPAD